MLASRGIIFSMDNMARILFWGVVVAIVVSVTADAAAPSLPSNGISYSASQTIRRNSLLCTIPKISRAYTVKFDFNPKVFQEGWTNIIHLTIGGDLGQYGDRIPGVWFHSTNPRSTKNRFYICSAVNGNRDFCWSSGVTVSRGQWTSVLITQQPEGNRYRYTVKVANAQIGSVINTQPREFSNVKVYASDNWYNAAQGSIRNLIIIPNTQGQSNSADYTEKQLNKDEEVVKKLQERMSRMESTMNESIHTESVMMNKLDKRITDIDNKLDLAMDLHNGRMDAMDQTISDMKNEVEKVESRLKNSTEQRISQVEIEIEKLANMERKLNNATDRKISEIDRKIEKMADMESKTKNVTDQKISQIEGKIENLINMESISKKQTDQKFSQMESKIEKIANLESRIKNTTDQKISQMESKIEKLANMDSRMKNTTDEKISQLESKIKNVINMESRIKNTTEERISQMESKIENVIKMESKLKNKTDERISQIENKMERMTIMESKMMNTTERLIEQVKKLSERMDHYFPKVPTTAATKTPSETTTAAATTTPTTTESPHHWVYYPRGTKEHRIRRRYDDFGLEFEGYFANDDPWVEEYDVSWKECVKFCAHQRKWEGISACSYNYEERWCYGGDKRWLYEAEGEFTFVFK